VGEASPPDDDLDYMGVDALRDATREHWDGNTDDELIRHVNAFADERGVHPLSLSYADICSLVADALPLFEEVTRAELVLRTVLLIMLNDTAAPLVPFLPEADELSKGNTRTRDCLRRYLFAEVKADLIRATSRPHDGSYSSSGSTFKSCFPVIRMRFSRASEPAIESSGSWWLDIEDSRRIFRVSSAVHAIDSILEETTSLGVTGRLLSEKR
jgi:hypothetical protein